MSCDSCEIKNLIYQYADHIDRGDLDEVAAMFALGKIVAAGADGRETDVVGAQAVGAMYRVFTRLYEDDGTPHTLHMTTNVVVNVDAAGVSASARSYAVVFQCVDDLPLQPIIGVRYHDRFEKSEQGWYFSERKIDSHLFGDLSKHLLQSV
jgi:hypothetical protein